MENPQVSVVIMTYNHAPFIAQCLDAVLAQETDFPFEILVGEDDSTDGTRKIVREYEQRFPEKIKVFYRKTEDKLFINGRMTGRFNFVETLKAARGKYIAMMDGDDYWISPQKLQSQADILDENPNVKICHHGAWEVDETGAEQVITPGVESIKIGTISDFAARKISIYHSSRMFRKKDLKFPDWFFECGFGDLPLTLITGDDGLIYYLDEKWLAYRIHGANFHVTHSKKQKTLYNLQIWDIVRRNLDYFHTDISSALKVTYFHSHFLIAKYSYRNREWGDGFASHWKALKLAGFSLTNWLYSIKLVVDMGVGSLGYFLK